MILLPLSSLCAKSPSANLTTFVGLPAEQFLTGKFDPEKNANFVCINDIGIPTDGRKHYLQKTAAENLKNLINDFNKDYPSIKLYVCSSTRNFNNQKRIWEGKWNGSTLVSGKNLSLEISNPEKRALEILKFSSMPGTSRHHWGTDVDFNELVNSYYTKGEGKIIYVWLNENAYKYGFFQPYTADRSQGYSEEKWHWSFVPLSKIYYWTWLELFGKNESQLNSLKFVGSEFSLKFATIFVQSVNEDCYNKDIEK